jgi:hypothetical protein
MGRQGTARKERRGWGKRERERKKERERDASSVLLPAEWSLGN